MQVLLECIVGDLELPLKRTHTRVDFSTKTLAQICEGVPQSMHRAYSTLILHSSNGIFCVIKKNGIFLSSFVKYHLHGKYILLEIVMAFSI